MNREVTLVSEDLAGVMLRSIAAADQENLRQWKNANRFAFFHQEIITPEQQGRWFTDYLGRERDFMFIVLADGEASGCLGFRMLGAAADIYNVILGKSERRGRGLMRNAMRLLCSYIVRDWTRDVGVKVLRTNPAIAWYKKIGFRETRTHDAYVELRLDLALFQPCRVQTTR